MNIAELSIQKKVITYSFLALITVGGIFAYTQLGRLEDPEFTIKDAQVITAYPGATAQEVEEEVTNVLEIAIQKMNQVDYVTSISDSGSSVIKVRIKAQFGADKLPQVWDELRRKINDAQRELPPGAGPSLVNDDFGDVYGVMFAVYGDGYSYRDLREYAKDLRRELLLVDQVGKVTLFGDQLETVYVEITQSRLAELGISPDMILNTLKGQNLVSPSGHLQVGEKYLAIRPTGEFASVADIGELLILNENGQSTKLRLKDVAKIVRGYEDPPKKIFRFNGKPAVAVAVSTTKGGNVVVMGEALKRRMRELRRETPIGIEFGQIWVQSNVVNASINNFMVNLVEALLIVIGCLVFTMGLMSATVIGIVLLLVIFATFILMMMQGVMLERISLGALIIALGMLVDNAIVVVEGMLIGSQRGMSRPKAAGLIVQQTMWPLLGATAIAILAFSAIGMSNDNTGEYCRSLFYVLLYSLGMSWVLAVTAAPLFGDLLLKNPPSDSAGKDPYAGGFFQKYRTFLEFCMARRRAVIVVLAAALALSIVGFKYVPKTFFPNSTSPLFFVHVWLPQGTDINATSKMLAAKEKDILKLEHVTSVATSIGGGAPRFVLTYTPEDPNSAYGLYLVSVDEFQNIDRVAPKIQKLLNEAYPDALIMPRKFMLGPGEAQKLHARLRGPDHKMLRRLGDEISQVIAADPLTQDVVNDWRGLVPLLRPKVAEEQARNAGITRAQIDLALNRTFDGQFAGYYRERDELLPMKVRSPLEERINAMDIGQARIWSPVAQRNLPLSQMVIGVETVSENTRICRRDRLPTLTVKADPITGQPATKAFASIRPKVEQRYQELVKKLGLMGYSLTWGGEYEDTYKAQSALAKNVPVPALLMIMILIFLFGNIRQPLIILLTIPLAAVGVTIGLLSTQQPFGFMALLGFMSLSGMLIKNAIVLIDEVNAQLAAGTKPYEAVLVAGVSRLRPVSMAALTTVLGMIPLVVDAFFASMAVTIIFGLTLATVLTLVVVPVLYVTIYKIPSPAPAAAGRRKAS
jgi:multidrug efflux pump subunit AcrB